MPAARQSAARGKEIMSWEKVRRTDHGRGFWLSISVKGAIIWSRAVDEAMGRPDYLELFYDSERGRLGIRPAAQGDDTVMAYRPMRCATIKGLLWSEDIWERLSLPIVQAPASVDEENIWSIPIGEGVHHE